jgi:hypothetical protein
VARPKAKAKAKAKAKPKKAAAQEQHPNSTSKRRVVGKPFPPGQSGNPGGRPKGRSITALLREGMDKTALAIGVKLAEGQTVAEGITDKLLSMALDGNMESIAVILDRTEGKVSQPLDVTGETVQTVFYLPDNGRDGHAGTAETQGGPPATGAAGAVPLDTG